MANKTQGAVNSAPVLSEQDIIKDLSQAAKEQVVAEYIGIHPKYFVYAGAAIKIDVYKMSMDGVNWTGFNV